MKYFFSASFVCKLINLAAAPPDQAARYSLNQQTYYYCRFYSVDEQACANFA